MPKQRITKEMVIDAAFEITRRKGIEQAMVKSIAETLHCSVQPIYSYCKNMDGLRNDVTERARAFIQEFVIAHIEKDDLFRSTGRAYIRIAKEEPHLFKLFIFQERKNISSLDDLYRAETNPEICKAVAERLQISIEAAKQFHLHMLIYTIGIGTIFSVTASQIAEEEIYQQQELAYQAFFNFIMEEQGHE